MRTENPKTPVVLGILAHADAGKTTLSEQILYRSGVIRRAGRVDSRDTCFDYFSQERRRGITIFSKQTGFEYNDRSFTLIDTPGHVDFAAETRRAVSVLDAAILVVSGVEGVEAQTEVWQSILEERKIPTFIFVSKNDRDTADKDRTMKSIRDNFNALCVDFTTDETLSESSEDIVSLRDDWLADYLENGSVIPAVESAVSERMVIPTVFGSALTGEGVDRLLELVARYTPTSEYGSDFSATVYKTSYDSKGERLSYMKITGGIIRTKDTVGDEKINQIRICNGEKFCLVPEAKPGMVCAVTGLDSINPGRIDADGNMDRLEPVSPAFSASVLAKGVDTHTLAGYLNRLSDEMPEMTVRTLRVNGSDEISIGVMGKIQLEVISEILDERFGVSVSFGECSVLYKETIADTVMGYGHYEPLRHYAETQLRLEPAPRGSGVSAVSECSLEMLDRNFQYLILTHITEKEHVGMLTGSPLTDVRIVITAGRSHLKHTEGGDFREATYRAIRQGLEKAQCILLEPYYSFSLKVPSECVGRALNDMQVLSCNFEPPQPDGSGAVIKGEGPVSELMNYAREVASYTKGRGVIIFGNAGMRECHNTQDVIEKFAYEKDRDIDNPSSSIFCSHGAGFEVKWQDVDNMRHVKI